MGNETSQLAGLEIEEKAVEVTDFWIHSSASLYNDSITPLSVFIGESFIEGSLWTNQTPLEKMTKNLMLHRHPCILKYISSWNKGSKHYLAVEYVKPLAHAISTQTPLQICIGLYSVLKAITFLNEKALSSHNNVCSASVYVTKDGSWKLGGLEYLCRYDDLTVEYLNKAKAHRYEKAIDPNEQTNVTDVKYVKSGAIDKYGFSVLVHELLHSLGSNGDIPCLEEFKQFCKNELQNKNFTSLPSFQSILEHSYFTHDFIIIYSFLTELALKNETEKRAFFTELTTRLKVFPEELVARQLGELLLSRLVLLDETACQRLLPNILRPRANGSAEDGSVFSVETFQQHIVPRLLHIFCVRDAQIRLLLLSHFKGYVQYFNKEQLQNHILPELLIGIKDTSDHLVAVTLVALAELVPVLGAAVVIGGKRLRLFNDGRPAVINRVNHRSVDRSRRASNMDRSDRLELPERLSPDGGEDETPTIETDFGAPDEDLDSWSDWDAEERISTPQNINETPVTDFNINSEREQVPVTSLGNKNVPRPQILTDISSLDIKSQLSDKIDVGNEFNYFLDMEPVIEKPSTIFIDKSNEKEIPNSESNQINLLMAAPEENTVNEDCWGDDLSWVKE